jgi:hypothetical protein
MKEDINNDYLKGFNDAYVLMDDKSDLINFLINKTTTNNYLLGLKDGQVDFLNNIIFPPNKRTKIADKIRRNS